MDWSWLNKFSGGLDVLPIFIALIGAAMMFRLPAAHQIEDKLARTFAWMCFISLPVAQVSWIVAVIREVPMLGSVMDNVWTIYNFASLLCIMLLLHRRGEG